MKTVCIEADDDGTYSVGLEPDDSGAQSTGPEPAESSAADEKAEKPYMQEVGSLEEALSKARELLSPEGAMQADQQKGFDSAMGPDSAAGQY